MKFVKREPNHVHWTGTYMTTKVEVLEERSKQGWGTGNPKEGKLHHRQQAL